MCREISRYVILRHHDAIFMLGKSGMSLTTDLSNSLGDLFFTEEKISTRQKLT